MNYIVPEKKLKSVIKMVLAVKEYHIKKGETGCNEFVAGVMSVFGELFDRGDVARLVDEVKKEGVPEIK